MSMRNSAVKELGCYDCDAGSLAENVRQKVKAVVCGETDSEVSPKTAAEKGEELQGFPGSVLCIGPSVPRSLSKRNTKVGQAHATGVKGLTRLTRV